MIHEELPVRGRIEEAVRYDRSAVQMMEAEERADDYGRPEVMTDEEPRERDPEPECGERHPVVHICVIFRRRIIGYDRRPFRSIIVVHCAC